MSLMLAAAVPTKRASWQKTLWQSGVCSARKEAANYRLFLDCEHWIVCMPSSHSSLSTAFTVADCSCHCPDQPNSDPEPVCQWSVEALRALLNRLFPTDLSDTQPTVQEKCRLYCVKAAKSHFHNSRSHHIKVVTSRPDRRITRNPSVRAGFALRVSAMILRTVSALLLALPFDSRAEESHPHRFCS